MLVYVVFSYLFAKRWLCSWIDRFCQLVVELDTGILFITNLGELVSTQECMCLYVGFG